MKESATRVPARRPLPEALTMAVWAGALLAAAELAILGIRKFVLQEFLWLSPRVVWMVPVVFVTAFVVSLLLLRGVTRSLPRLGRDSVLFPLIVFPGFVSVLLVYPRLHPYAVLILAAGLALRAGGWFARHDDRWWRQARRRVPWITALVVAAALLLEGGGWLAERWATARLAAVPSAPNILLIILDTVRASNLSVYGYERNTTPALEALARTGVTFDRAISPSSWTLPSHATMFTGVRLRDHRASWRTPLRGGILTLAEALRERGYATGGFVANTLYAGYETGLDRGFIRYEDYHVTPGEFVLSTALGRTIANHGWVRDLVGFHDVIGRKDAHTVTHDFLDWQSGAPRPFFAFLNYLDAHEPYASPPGFEDRFGPVEPRDPSFYQHRLRTSERAARARMPEAEQRAELNAYDGAIAYLDHMTGVLLDSLAVRGVLDNTIVIVTADHGEHFGEWGKYAHGDGLYLPVIRVPLIIAHGNRLPPGRRVPTAVSLEHLPATVWELAGSETASPFPGGSLAASWRDGATSPEDDGAWAEWDETTGEPRWMVSILADGYQYVRSWWRDVVAEELYDLSVDPAAMVDRSRDPAHADRIEAFREVIRAEGAGSMPAWVAAGGRP